MTTPRISVVVISRNESPFLRHTVDNLSDTLPGDAEIIVDAANYFPFGREMMIGSLNGFDYTGSTPNWRSPYIEEAFRNGNEEKGCEEGRQKGSA
ncbi:MAG TPA: glycosyltransferase [Bryobacteraceae bacterium]|jgi:hypothetical protein|nr:glycosyltransferase [Bryobacteraceae bacterium]